MAAISLWAVVQHSGYGYGGDPTFQLGLETNHVTTAAARDRVKRAGGVLFATYGAADDYCMKEMYRDVPEPALVPRAPGMFSDKVIDGLRIYKPADRPATAVDA